MFFKITPSITSRTKKKAKPLGTILFNEIRDVKLENDSNTYGHNNVFLLTTDDRVYPLSADTSNEALEWMNPIRALAKIHNSRNEFKDKQGFADSYKHFLFTSAKKSLTDTIKITGISKALVGKRANKARAEQIFDDVYSENDNLGRAAINGSTLILSCLEDVFSLERVNQLCEALNIWKQTIPSVIKFADGTPNQAAAEATYKMVCDTLDEIIHHERPSPVVEISQSLDVLFLKLARYQFLDNQEQRSERAKELRNAATEFINSANYVGSALPLDKRSDLLKKAEKVPDDIHNVIDAVKNAAFFSDDEHQAKQREEIAKFKFNIQELCLIYENEWGKSVRKPGVVKEIGSSNAPDKSMEVATIEITNT